MSKFFYVIFLIALYIVRAPFAIVSFFTDNCLIADYVSDVLGEIADEVKNNMAQNIKDLVQEIKSIVNENRDYYIPRITLKRNEEHFNRAFINALTLPSTRNDSIWYKIKYHFIDAIVILIAILAVAIVLSILKIFFIPARFIWNITFGIIF